MDLEFIPNTAGASLEEGSQKKTTKIKSELDENQKKLVTGLTKQVDSNLIIEQPHAMVSTQQNAIEILSKQLDFYFGDPNLSKDKFFRDLIAKHPKGYVELKALLGFHKVGQILNAYNISKFEDRLNCLRQAVTSSAILKICKQSLRVKRRIPFDTNILKDADFLEDVNARTIYVENIPMYATPELVARVFIKYGHILLVNLPKEAEGKTKRNKGFGFIEFEVG